MTDRTGKSIKELLGFGNEHPDRSIQVASHEWGKYFGELNDQKLEHGRGISYTQNGLIFIGYYERGCHAPGKFVYYKPDGTFQVYTVYIKNR